MIKATVIADSITRNDSRLTTLECEFPRFVLAEVNTHRVFSRNSASSRAIPSKKLIDRVLEDPYIPQFWGRNQPGMSAMEAEAEDPDACTDDWLAARDYAVRVVQDLSARGVHKQWANRLIEPFMWHTAIISSVEWSNFFAQRCHEAALPEFRELAEAMRDAIKNSEPEVLMPMEWHMPYIEGEERFSPDAHKVAVARCCRVSYLNHNGMKSWQDDLELYEKLVSQDPPHASPLEHVARPARMTEHGDRNFGSDWMQLRQLQGM